MSPQTATRDGSVLLTPADIARLANVSRARSTEKSTVVPYGPLYVGGRLLRIDPTDFCRWLEGGTE